MMLDLDHWSQRATYYHGRFYDLAAQRLIHKLLSTGDTFVDVGANIGMLTLSAARTVGPSGTVLAFEPNPESRKRLVAHVAMNDLGHVKVMDHALSFERGTSTLTMPTASSGRSTLRDSQGQAVQSYEVSTALLDDFADAIEQDGRTMIKVDTEGFELNVLKGAESVLSRSNVCVLVEVTDAWLRELGQSAEELFSFMADRGYRPYHAWMQPRGLRQHLVIEPVTLPGPHHQFDALFVRGQDAAALVNA